MYVGIILIDALVLQTNMQYWGKNVKETEANLRDMVSHRRDK